MPEGLPGSAIVLTWWAMHEESQLVGVALNSKLALLPGEVVHLHKQMYTNQNQLTISTCTQHFALCMDV